ncbi:MAG TPA: HAMP domain-containing sensor histidine kinase, partial [Candidatus Dormibacteraeota bacterium]|nr:HAMP domain-containing sensor histidine kinase [Candidatus Dormibacteraeota bacterium]
TVVDWLRLRERSRGYLALALATLGLTSAVGLLNTLTGYRLGAPVGDLALILFMASGYALLLFRDTFIPLSRRLRIGALVVAVAATAFALAVGIPSDVHRRPTTLQSMATIGVVVVWSACVVEPIVRFWIASRRRPAVQRARLRAIAGGYGAIVLILLVAGFGGAAATNPVVQWLFEAVAIVALPLLYVSFAAPKWLRRLWRQSEEDAYRDAVHDLVLFSPDRPTLAKRAAEWGLRLVGAEGIAVVDANGEVLALRGLAKDTALQLAGHVDPKGQPSLLATPGSRREDAIVVPLPLDLGVGAMVVVSGPYTPFFGTDEMSGLRGYAANITAALDRARVTERLAALEKTKSQFLNLASHELRSPLGVINGYLSMLEQGSLGQLQESGLRAVEVLKTKTAELNLLVAQMLDSARLEDGRLALKRERLDLREVAADALQVVRPLAGPDHVLTIETPPVAVTVLGDADRIKTIVSNLLENAIKYSPTGGQVQCAVSVADGVATLRVVDSGVGVAHEDLPRLFNRFERIEHRATSHVGGTGLGLYLSRELARQHGGDIRVESRPGSGSTFTLTLPLVVAAPPESVPVESEPQPAAPRLHVVDAEADVDSESRLA